MSDIIRAYNHNCYKYIIYAIDSIEIYVMRQFKIKYFIKF